MDLLVLLLFLLLFQPEHCKVLFSTGTKSAAKVWNVKLKVVQAAIGAETSVKTSCLVMQWEDTILQVAFSL